MRLSPDEEFSHKVTKVSVRHDCFEGGIEAIPWEQRKPSDEFDYGYVLSVPKAQGSLWDDVVLFEKTLARILDIPESVPAIVKPLPCAVDCRQFPCLRV